MGEKAREEREDARARFPPKVEREKEGIRKQKKNGESNQGISPRMRAALALTPNRPHDLPSIVLFFSTPQFLLKGHNFRGNPFTRYPYRKL